MFDKWDSLTVKKIDVVVYVKAGMGRMVHKDRPSHGFVLNDGDSEKTYVFSDGREMKTAGGDLFYLPKGSSYYVKTKTRGGCYAINFEVEEDFLCEPFSLHFRNSEKLVKIFKTAEKEWRAQSDCRYLTAKKAVYDILLQLIEEGKRRYQTNARYRLIEPAVERIAASFTDPELTVSSLAALCGISEVYFRKLFFMRFGTSPKDYIVSLRIGYAKQLLAYETLSVGQVAEACGYVEPAHFSREFARRVGCAPRDYKET